MEFIKQPMAIERRSMELIAPYIEGISLSEAEKKVYSRIIHAAGDVEYAPIIRISETAVADATAALRGGRTTRLHRRHPRRLRRRGRLQEGTSRESSRALHHGRGHEGRQSDCRRSCQRDALRDRQQPRLIFLV